MQYKQVEAYGKGTCGSGRAAGRSRGPEAFSFEFFRESVFRSGKPVGRDGRSA
jgi:hypothetical protein